MQGIGGDIEFSSKRASFELHGAITAIAQASENVREVGQEEEVHRGISRQLLLQAEITCLLAEAAFLEQRESFPVAVVKVGPRAQTGNVIHEKIKLVELGAGGIEKIRRNAARGPIEKGGELRESNWVARKFSGGTATEYHLFNGVTRDFGVAQWF